MSSSQVLTPILAPLSWAFGQAVELRSFLYEKKIMKSFDLGKPVISVGNITVGGTGKTPFVDILIRQLEDKGLRVGVLTRGYGRKSEEITEVLGTSSSDQCGDEPLWLKHKHPQAQIIVGADRVKASKKLSKVDIIILDDGMQHLKIKRDLEITLIDSTKDKNHYRLLPWGRARENLNALKRSDFVVLTKTNLSDPDPYEELVDRVFEEGILDLIESETVFVSAEDVLTGNRIFIKGKKVYLCSGIANPLSFENTVKAQEVKVLGHEILSDHAQITENRINDVFKKAQEADLILITEKDAVKWKEVFKKQGAIPLAVVKTEMTFNPELPSFYDLISHSSH